jgi:hypothetical protein
MLSGGVLLVHAGHGPVRIGGLSMSFPVFKLLLQLLLTGLNVACWLVPMKVKRFSQNKELISLANAFSGGVFLSLAFGHMIPHSTHGFEALVRKRSGRKRLLFFSFVLGAVLYAKRGL